MKVFKGIIGIIILVALCLLGAYLIQYPLYRFDARETPPYVAILLLSLCGVVVFLLFVLAAVLNNHFKWFTGIDMATVMAYSAIILFLLILLAFSKIPVPYSWLPSNNEMAFSFGQFLIQIFSGVAALLIASGCVIYIKIKKKNEGE